MTREEAIECNKNLRMYMELSDKNQPYKFLEENYIALDMAIKALEQEPCEDCITLRLKKGTLKYSNKDYVVYKKEWLKKWWQPELALLGIELPSVQPKTDVLDKIRAEIKAISISGQVDEHTMFVRSAEQVKQMALDVIDKYKAESEETDADCN